MRAPMVPVLTAGSTFEARVVAARLGAEGFLWELRGNVDGPYPVGPVHVLVPADQLEAVRELLLIDEVEDCFRASALVGARAGRRDWTPWVVAVAVGAVVAVPIVRLATAGA